MIKVEGTITRVERSDFEISEQELLKSLNKLDQTDVLNQVRKNFVNICLDFKYPDAFLYNGSWYVYVNNGSHYSGDEKIREATPKEREFWSCLTDLIVDYKMAIQSHLDKGDTA